MSFSPRLTRFRLLILLPVILLASCRLVITTDGTGYFESDSGSYDCTEASCVINITQEFIETFTAVPAPGYRFVRWEGHCKNEQTDSCMVHLVPVQDSELADDVALSAMFEPTTRVRRWYRDSDGDNFGNPDVSMVSANRPDGYVVNRKDCDDSDGSIYPWTNEILDSIDNNCNGEIDEGRRRYYRDVDGDGYGNEDDRIIAIGGREGYSSIRGDCDDGNSAIHPRAEEAFDSVDNDCDGEIDEDFIEREYFRDIDDDGYGDSSASVLAHGAPEGYVTLSGDNCVEVHNPEQTDLDNDGIGDACDIAEEESCQASAEAQAMLDAVNDFRSEARLCGDRGTYPAASPLTWSCELEEAALVHSTDMANNNFFSHTGSDRSSAGQRATRAGYSWTAWGENIAAGGGLRTPEAALQLWIDSPGHCTNLMEPVFEHLGAAKSSSSTSTYGIYWTQVFGRGG